MPLDDDDVIFLQGHDWRKIRPDLSEWLLSFGWPSYAERLANGDCDA